MQLKLENDITINQSAERLWQILAEDFVHISDWASPIAASRINKNATKSFADAPVGGRICTVPGYGEVSEQITHFDIRNKSYAYRATSSAMPNFVTNMENHWSIHELEADKCIVRSRAAVTMKNFPGFLVAPFMRIRFGRMGKAIAQDLTNYAKA